MPTARALKTQADVAKLPARKGETVYFDQGPLRERVTGLTLRVREGGSRKWVYFYRWAGKQQKLTIGDASALTLADARREARKQHLLRTEHKNPIEQQRITRQAATIKPTAFKSVMDDYLAARQRDMRPRSYAECKRHLELHWKPLHALDLKAIDQGTVAALLNEIERKRGPIARNRARSTLSALFTWAIAEAHLIHNPVDATRKVDEKTRERVLTNAELAAIWNAAGDTDYDRIVRLLMLTGQRREEIGSLQWSEIITDAQGRKLIALPGQRTKNSRPHDVPLSAEALTILEGIRKTHGRPYVFGMGAGGYSGWSRSKLTLDAATALAEPWTLHDLRRTMATRMADSPDDGGLGIQPHVIEAMLNHVSGHKAGVAGIYNRSTYAAEKRAALEAWGKHLQIIVAQTNGANVVRMQGRK